MYILMSWLKIILVVQILFSFVFGRGYVVGDKVAWWLAHWTLDREVRVSSPGQVIVLCSWARHFTLTVPLSTQE